MIDYRPVFQLFISTAINPFADSIAIVVGVLVLIDSGMVEDV